MNKKMSNIYEDFATKFETILQKVNFLIDSTQKIDNQNKQIENHCLQLEAHKNKLQHLILKLDQIQIALQNSAAQNINIKIDSNSQVQFDKNVQKYKQTLKTQDQILTSFELEVPSESLKKLEKYFSNFDEQKLITLVQKGKQQRETIENLEKVKEKYERIKQNKSKHLPNKSGQKNSITKDNNN